MDETRRSESEPENLVAFGDNLVAQEASRWVARRSVGDLTAEEADAFFEFISANPESLSYYRKYKRLWEELDDLAAYQKRTEGEWEPVEPVEKGWRRLLVVGGLAAAIMLGIGWGLSSLIERSRISADHSQDFAAKAYERHELPDGSVVELNAGTAMRVRYDEGSRHIELLASEAHFSVAKDPLRPFVVSAAGVDVVATGTAFNVKLSDENVEVLVTEGEVQLQQLRQAKNEISHNILDTVAGTAPSVDSHDQPIVAPLTPQIPVNLALSVGQFAAIPVREGPSSQTEVEEASQADLSEKLSWKPMLLTFDSHSLSDAVDVFNRVNKRQIIFGNEEIKSIPIVASFRSANLEHFVELLQLSFDVRAEFVGDDLVVLKKQNQSHPE